MRLLQRKNNPKRHAREKILINRLEWKASANAGVSTDTKRGCFINIHLSEFRDHDDPFVYDLEIQDSEVPDLIATLTERLAKAKEMRAQNETAGYRYPDSEADVLHDHADDEECGGMCPIARAARDMGGQS